MGKGDRHRIASPHYPDVKMVERKGLYLDQDIMVRHLRHREIAGLYSLVSPKLIVIQCFHSAPWLAVVDCSVGVYPRRINLDRRIPPSVNEGAIYVRSCTR